MRCRYNINLCKCYNFVFHSFCLRLFCPREFSPLIYFSPLNSFFLSILRRKALRKTSSSTFFMKRGKLMFYLCREKKEFIMLKNELMIHFIYHKMCLHRFVLGRSFSFKFIYLFILCRRGYLSDVEIVCNLDVISCPLTFYPHS